MKRKNFYLTEPQIEALEEKAEELDIAFAELVRRALDYYLEQKT